MMDTFGVSRPTIREALRVAESLGLVTVRHGDPGGPRVLGQPSVGVARVLHGLLSAERTSVTELLEARMVLEGAAARLAARPDAELGPLEDAYRAMEHAPDFARFVEADALFHRRVAEVGGNRLLVVILTARQRPDRATDRGEPLRCGGGPGPGEDPSYARGDPQGDPRPERRRGRSPIAAPPVRPLRRTGRARQTGAPAVVARLTGGSNPIPSGPDGPRLGDGLWPGTGPRYAFSEMKDRWSGWKNLMSSDRRYVCSPASWIGIRCWRERTGPTCGILSVGVEFLRHVRMGKSYGVCALFVHGMSFTCGSRGVVCDRLQAMGALAGGNRQAAGQVLARVYDQGHVFAAEALGIGAGRPITAGRLPGHGPWPRRGTRKGLRHTSLNGFVRAGDREFQNAVQLVLRNPGTDGALRVRRTSRQRAGGDHGRTRSLHRSPATT